MSSGQNPADPARPAGLREAADTDSWALAGLIGACWSEYPGCIMDVHGECPELLAPASYYRSLGGGLWVVPDGGWLAACIGLRPGRHDHVELVKLYVARPHRRRGLGRAMADVMQDRARARHAKGIELWSDTRFGAAHRLYRALGYQSTGETRELHDLSHTVEYHFRKTL